MTNKIQELNKKSEIFEHALLCALINSPVKLKNLLSNISPEDFRSKHARVFKIVYDAFFADEEITTKLYTCGVSVSEYLTTDYLTDSQLVGIAEKIKDTNFTFKLLGVLEDGMVNIDLEKIEEGYSELHGKLISLSHGKSEERSEIKELMSEFEIEQKEYSERLKNGQKYIGFPSGFEDIDKVIDGLREGHLWVLGGYTSSGKTFCVLNMVYEALKQKKRVVFLSLEMSKMQIISRLIGIIAGVNATEALKGVLFEEEVENIAVAKKFLFSSRFVIYNELNIMDRIKATMYQQMYREKVDMFVVDYLQLVSSGKNKTEYETMRDAVKEFQQIGHKLKVPIILLSQISNESAKAPSSQVMGFKGAGDIAAAADLAIEFQSDELDNDERMRKIQAGEAVDVKAIIKKNRHGKTGQALLTFDGRTGRFSKRKKYD